MRKLYKKILTGAFILLFTFIFKLPNLDAASCRIGVSAPSSVVVGQSFKVTVTVSSSSSIGSWEYTLSYDSSKVRLKSGTLHVVDYGNGSKKSASYSYTFTALTSGTATFKPVNASVLDYTSTNECLSSTGSKSVSMKTQAEIEASYSRNNNLSSLSVDGAELSPAFNADTLEYEATLPVDTTKAKINATAADSTATIEGIGEIDVVDGLNKVEVVVTAQHGEKKTYVINLTVEELDPINVKVDGKNYTIVRKSGQIEDIPVGFTETKITIEDQEITAYKSKVANLTLVALKDEEGEISLFIYNKDTKKFSKFNEASGNTTYLLVLEEVDQKIPYGFKTTTIKIGDKKVSAYKYILDNDSNYYLVYAKNLQNGDKGFYLYDKDDGTFQRYYETLDNSKNTIIMCSIGSLVLLILILFICLLKKLFTSKQKKISKYEKKIKKLSSKLSNQDDDEENNDGYDITSINEEPIIKKVEEDEYVVPRKSRKEKLKEIDEAKKRLDKTKPTYHRVSLEDDDV